MRSDFLTLMSSGSHSALVLAGMVFAADVAAQQSPPIGDIGTIDSAEAAKRFRKPGYSPYAGRNYPARVFWGDSHLHTAMSLDARTAGNTLGPEEALRFSRGEEVVSATGVPAKLCGHSIGSSWPTTRTRWVS
jgi:Protein of unknown function (DUF3604)